MPQVSVKRIIALTIQQAFAVASNVGEYPKFIPLVSSAKLLDGPVEKNGIKRFSAMLQIAAGPFGGGQGFVSQVVADSNRWCVTATSQDGPIKELHALWQFHNMAGSRCAAEITIDYAFKSALLQLAASALMNKAITRVMEAFETRGRELYPISALSNI